MKAIIYAGVPYTQQVKYRKDLELTHKGVRYNHELEIILDEVCKYLSINVSDVKSKNRMLKTKIARFYYVYLSKQLTKYSLSDIGSVIYRHHATVIHANKTVTDWLSYDKEVINQLEEIETLIKDK